MWICKLWGVMSMRFFSLYSIYTILRTSFFFMTLVLLNYLFCDELYFGLLCCAKDLLVLTIFVDERETTFIFPCWTLFFFSNSTPEIRLHQSSTKIKMERNSAKTNNQKLYIRAGWLKTMIDHASVYHSSKILSSR